MITETLEDAGIHRKNCRAVISNFYKEDKNLRIAIFCKFLNPNIKVITKATKRDTITSLLDTDIAKVENPFEIFAKRLEIALTAPHIMILENWIYKNHDLTDEATFLPQGKYIICGYGRLGKVLKEKLNLYGISYVFIDETVTPDKEMIENGTFISANADDKDTLIDAGIEEASVLIAGTQNDIDNISIILTAQKLNPDLYIIARENTMKEASIFQAANINWLFMIEHILINKTSLQLANPLKHLFLKKIIYKDETWGNALVNLLKSQLGDNPELMNLTITQERTYALYNEIKSGEKINIDILLKSLRNWTDYHKAIPLLLKRNNQEILLPHDEILELGDQILFACDKESREEIEYISSNIYDLHYIRTGEEKQNWFLKKILHNIK